jgi:hypothetical protein
MVEPFADDQAGWSGLSTRPTRVAGLPPVGSGGVAMENVHETRYVQAEGQRRLVRCFDPVTGDIVASWPGDLSGGVDRRLLHRGEYEPDPPEDFPWPTDGSPCVTPPATG